MADRQPLAFPEDDYTPHGYLQNRYDAGPWWGLSAGGPLRSLPACGLEWHRSAAERGGLLVGVEVDGEVLLRPADFAARGVELVSRRHTKNLLSFDFAYKGLRVELTFLLAERDAIACRARLSGRADQARLLAVALAAKGPGRFAGGVRTHASIGVAAADGPWYVVCGEGLAAASGFPPRLEDLPAAWEAGPAPSEAAYDYYLEAPTVYGVAAFPADLAGDGAELWLAAGRGATPGEALTAARSGLAAAPSALARLRAEDDAFWSRAPRLTGDWPAHWRRGWVYDLETTRMMVYPPAGVFPGPWPSWMAYRPRVVLAENALDMLRLACADPETAWDALETVFQTPGRTWSADPDELANVPCAIANGVYNMIASDGSICGTSPAWCLPFLNVQLLYFSHPDRERLARLYPRLAAYLDWWLRHRTDPQGWFVYKCTWESGEDNTPRLDPLATGHHDIAEFIRPVELQAAVAHSARVLVRLGRELGLPAAERQRWQAVYEEYRDRTRQLWDPRLGRFRDVERATGRFAETAAPYWGRPVEPNALQLIPLLDEIATPEQREALAARLVDFDAPPWVLWPSWSYVAAEAARAVGRRAFAAKFSYGIVERVYRQNDRRSLAEHAVPLPGEAREYWPLDLKDWGAVWPAHEAYGWGANTLTHVLRYLVGFGPGESTERFEFELAPALPEELLAPGLVYGLAGLRYRGRRVDVQLRPRADGALDVGVGLTPPGAVRVEDEAGRPVAVRHQGEEVWFTAQHAALYRLTS